MTVTATLVRTESSSEYQGVVYDQLVVIEIMNGPRLGVFDSDMLVAQSALGERKELSLRLLTGQSGIEQVSETEPRIEPADDSPLTWQGHVYFGRIAHVEPDGEHEYDASLDIGVGTVSIMPRKEEFPQLSKGTYLKTHALRTDLYGLEESVPED